MSVGGASPECKDNGAEKVAIPSTLSKPKYLVDILVPSHGIQTTHKGFLCLVPTYLLHRTTNPRDPA